LSDRKVCEVAGSTSSTDIRLVNQDFRIVKCAADVIACRLQPLFIATAHRNPIPMLSE
jgi:hypothetical protein